MFSKNKANKVSLLKSAQELEIPKSTIDNKVKGKHQKKLASNNTLK